ncbi:phage tail sheath protein FI [Agromyces sp. 3263]|uniref:phage tail sheath family protein n=1 Tax=Agromyces sp. 3263 TaxID=2817750 RepID=UPI00285AEED8|nr:phage tail sheath subtilisin-like domain-containing protein [Agromyces sp. 3263]MDR6904978.1 phage tail sheath protein FI [Agromyces sp. 3263]
MTRPIEGVGTATAAFVGLAEDGPIDTPTVVDGWGTDEDALYERYRAPSQGRALRSFFENGGATAVAVQVGDASASAVRGGLAALEDVDVNLLVLPAESAEREDAREIVAEAVAFCERRRAMLLVDPPPSWTSAEAIAAFLSDGAAAAVGTASPNAALYAPRLRHAGPAQAAADAPFPPSGAVAGVIARTDAAQGVWTAPAGQESEVFGADLEFELGQDDVREFGARGVNALRTFPGRRPIVWGARTLAAGVPEAGEWKYVPVRRTALFLEASIERGLAWTVFEPNDEPLWQEVRESVGAFLHDLFRAGAFHGHSPSDAFFVRCDRGTMSPEDLDAGELVVLVGFAPIRPAEFVVLRIRARALPPR